MPALKEQSISRGLVTYLPFTAGSLTDSLKNNNAIWGLSNTKSNFIDDFKGTANSAIQLNGSTDYIKLLDNKSLQFDTAFAISIWIKPVVQVLNPGTDRRIQIYNKSNFTTGAGEAYSSSMRAIRNIDGLPDIIAILADVKQGSNCESGRGWQSLSINTNRAIYENNGWHHLAFSYNRSTVSFYLDGVLLSISKLSNLNKIDNCVGGDLRFGVQHLKAVDPDSKKNYYNYFSGGMDEIRIYNRPLTATEVQTLYKLKDEG